MSAVPHQADIRQRRWHVRELPAPDVPSYVYLDLSKVTMLRVIPLSAQFGITRQGVSTTNRSPLSVKFRTCLVPTPQDSRPPRHWWSTCRLQRCMCRYRRPAYSIVPPVPGRSSRAYVPLLSVRRTRALPG